jgi:pimeloyl-ACP methyl ester carboxylesterase
METSWVQRGNVSLEVKVTGSGPLILCVHGWPELWYSWRHQMSYSAERGYQVAALNVRGYGASSHPTDIASYTLSELSADILAVATALSDEPVILFGHDWGAPQVYTAALRFPEHIRAVAGLSVPFIPKSRGQPSIYGRPCIRIVSFIKPTFSLQGLWRLNSVRMLGSPYENWHPKLIPNKKQFMLMWVKFACLLTLWH